MDTEKRKMRTKKRSLLLIFYHLLVVACFLLFVSAGCGKKKTKLVKKVEPAKTIVIPPVPEVKKTTLTVTPYAYKGHSFRDPFIPLVGGKVTGKGKEEKLTVADVRSFTVKGIIEDKESKIALLALPGGKNYVLREGRLIDSGGMSIAGIEGIIEKNRIIFYLSEADNPIEIKLNLLVGSPRVELFKKGEKAEMEKHFAKATELYKQRKYKEAISEWEKVLEIDAKHKLSKQKIEKARKKLQEMK